MEIHDLDRGLTLIDVAIESSAKSLQTVHHAKHALMGVQVVHVMTVVSSQPNLRSIDGQILSGVLVRREVEGSSMR